MARGDPQLLVGVREDPCVDPSTSTEVCSVAMLGESVAGGAHVYFGRCLDRTLRTALRCAQALRLVGASALEADLRMWIDRVLGLKRGTWCTGPSIFLVVSCKLCQLNEEALALCEQKSGLDEG